MHTPSCDALVDAHHPDCLTSQPPVFSSIAAALAQAPTRAQKPFVIFIRAGVYREKLLIDKPHITLQGEGRDNTRITYDDYSGRKDAAGNSLGTWRCASVIVRASDFTACDLSIENSFDYLVNDRKAHDDPTRTREPQAVALMTDRGADRCLLKAVQLLGYQDTLFTFSGRTLIRDSVIAGNIDFIFGAGQTVICNSDLVTRPRAQTCHEEMGAYITAPSTPLVEKYGLTLMRCRLLKENALVAAGSCPLGRPWHPTTSFPDGRYADPLAIGAAVFIDCWMDDHITASGWDRMQGSARQAGQKDWFYPDRPEHARFAEYCSTGPGAQINSQRPQLSTTQAAQYRIETIFRGWHPG